MSTETYELYGLLAELLSVAQFQINAMPHVAVALNKLAEARRDYESANSGSTEEETKETADETDSNNPGA